MTREIAALVALAVLNACAAGAGDMEAAAAGPSSAQAPAIPPPAGAEARPSEATRISDESGLQRLLANKGITLQWIDWNVRGSLLARMEDDVLRLTGVQNSADGPGKLFLDGSVVEIGEEHFTFEGTIRITNTPDPGRICEAKKVWRFAITQNRPYYRLREFEWCDDLTDYIDIYF